MTDCHYAGLRFPAMPLTKRVTANQLSEITLSEGLDDVKLQFPPLPREWKDRYVPGQMFKYQASLPKLPVPPLQQTLHKYIASIEVCKQSCVCVCKVMLQTINFGTAHKYHK